MVYLCWAEHASFTVDKSQLMIFSDKVSLMSCPRSVVIHSDIIVEVDEADYPSECALDETYVAVGKAVKDRRGVPGRKVEVTFHIDTNYRGDVKPKLHYISDLNEETEKELEEESLGELSS